MQNENKNNLITNFSFSKSEQELILGKLYKLLEKQAAKHNGVDSTSMPVEKAQDLLESLLYTIEVTIENGITKEELLNSDFSLLIEQGQNILKEKLTSAKVEWKLMCQDLPQIQNVYYLSTIKNLSQFFQNYDIYYGTHHIPCSIDYWPLCPVSETIKGINYIEEYLHRIQIENDFLHCFEHTDIIMLYERYLPDYADSLFNLCDPVLTNAIGLGLLEEDIHKLNISSTHRITLYQILEGASIDELQSLLKQAVLYVCQRIGMTNREEQEYFVHAASELAFRIHEALKHQDLSHIFISTEGILPLSW